MRRISGNKPVLYSADHPHWNALSKVATITEIAKMWAVDWKTVQYWIDESNIVAVKSCGIWLVSLDSVIAFRGMPLENSVRNGL